MSDAEFVRITDFEMDDPVTIEMISQATGVGATLIVRLVRSGLLETVGDPTSQMLVPRRAIIRLRRMQRLRIDLGVNFAGAAVILDLVDRMEQMKRELTESHRSGNR